MNIIAPVKTADSLGEFISLGVNEVYSGVVYKPWNDKFGQFVEYNRRGNYSERANCKSMEEIKPIIDECNKKNVKFYFTMNALKISEIQMFILEKILEDLKNFNVAGIIVSDLNMVEFIAKKGFKSVASSCANINNHYLADLYIKGGCVKIIFPRYMSLFTMKRIAEFHPEIEYEAFIMNSGCRYVDGNCFCIHGTEFGCQCITMDCAEYKYFKRDGKALSDDELYMMKNNRLEFQDLMFSACGQCFIYDLLNIVDSVKIVGRVFDINILKRDIALTAKNLDIAQTCKSREEYLAKMIVNDKTICKDHKNCYYKFGGEYIG